MTVYVKAGFGIMAAVLYAIGAYKMLDGALHTVDFSPGEAPEALVTGCGAAITAFVATQLGITIASGTGGNGSNGGFVERLGVYNQQSTAKNRTTAVVLVIDLLVLVGFGLFFVWLWVSPEHVAVAKDLDPLKTAPDYISLQAKAFVALVLAGAAGVGVAAVK